MNNFKRISITLFTAIYITVDLFGSFLMISPAKATPVTDAPLLGYATQKDVRAESNLSVTKVLTMSAMGVLINAVSYFARKISHDTAVYLASGGKGQGAMIFKDGVDEYMKNTALDTVGEAVGSLGEPFGLNLCQIPNPKLDISLKISYRNRFPTGQEPKPKCSWKELESSWGDIGNVMEKRYGPGGSKFVSETFNANLSVSQSDFGISLDTMSQLDEIYAGAKRVAELERTFTQGIKSVISPISGKTMTPAASIQAEIEGMSAAKQSEKTEGQIAGMYAAQLENLPAMAASVFLNTLVSSLLNNIMTGLFNDSPDSGSGSGKKGPSGFFDSIFQTTKKSAERVFSFLTAPTITQVDDYKIVDQLFLAKAIDTGLQQAVNRGNNFDTAMTIGEAAELNYLHRSWALIPPSHTWNSSEEKDCYTKAYCYSNLQKLRKARILPIGFELAALKSEPDEPWTLGKVIDGFEDCNQYNEADSTHPYCHLIDPNWVLKAPEARCTTKAVGPELIEDGVNKRQTECMDLKTCISKDDNGACNYWGYCVKEENIWRLGGEFCPDYYSTCANYQNTATKQSSSFLSRTVNFGQCDIKSVGCQAYSSEQSKDASGIWQWVTTLASEGDYKPFGRNQMIYFNRNIETCPSSAEGCSAFYGAGRDSNTGIFNKSNDKYIRDSANLIHLKKAPDYLSCYDTNAADLKVDWPKSKTEVLTKLADNDARCDGFAQVCAPEEVGCGKFSPTAGGSALTAIVDVNSVCFRECVGYESFKQEESNFEGGKFPMYFIPGAGKACSVRSVGCSEFTNLSSTAGGEGLVYYDYTRLCEKPDKIDEKAFFSWEGSESEGYVLRNHLLKTINAVENAYIGVLPNLAAVITAGGDTIVGVFPVGSPSYGNNDEASLIDDYNTCNEDSYKLLITDPFVLGAANADCRQLYDDKGKIFYRILKDTVVIDASCQRLRKSDTNLFTDTNITDAVKCPQQGGYWDGSACKRCYGGGKYVGDSCIYEALPSESASCAAVDNGCRAYTGNAGNNVRPGIIFDTFEGDPASATTNWNVKTVSAESLQTGQHSLKINVATVDVATRAIPAGTLNENGWYELSFWARGVSRNLSVYFMQGSVIRGLFTVDSRDPLNPLAENPITIGNDWQEYRLGPVQFTGKGNIDADINIEVAGATVAGDYFIDNFSLSQVEDSIYLVKDSWKQVIDFNGEQILADAPAACFMGVTPGGSLPGAALGCREFKDESNNTYYLTGFSALCREAAVGCQPMFESNNTVGETLATVYNLVCTGSVDQCTLNISGTTGSCYIAPGQTNCHVPKMTLPVVGSDYTILSDLPGTYVDISTIYVPPENANPVYLANVSQYQCGSDQRGCTLLGLQDQTVPTANAASYKYSDTYILNNPDYYESTLCRQDLIGCNEYTAGANAYYFKDPVKNGNNTCSYKEDVDGFSGWFKDNVGACSNNGATLCKENSDCPLVAGIAGTCENIGGVPCYPDYLQEENQYGIWSNKSTNYAGFTGVCEQNFSGCTEFVDPQDTSSFNPDGKPYYRIMDNKLTKNVADCEGQVSLKEGCVLFDRTDQPNKLYNTEKTYEASNSVSPRYSLVNPVSDSANNANIILKVNRDRECSEWLACKNLSTQTNNKGKKETLCSKYQACDKFIVGRQDSKEGCANFIEPAVGESFLDAEKYIDRDVSWYGFDYSGYSILQKHQVGGYEYLSFFGDDGKQYLGVNLQTASKECKKSGIEDTLGDSCDDNKGRCYVGKCIYTIDGSSFPEVQATDTREQKIEGMRQALLPATCKAYPEDTAPFPRSIAATTAGFTAGIDEGQKSEIKKNADVDTLADRKRTDFVILNDKFSGVSVCQDGTENCSCNYKKYTYGAGAMIDYYDSVTSTNSAFAPKGVCVGGDKAGEPCEKDAHCITKDGNETVFSGSCSKLKQIDTKLGLMGFCLEPDLSRPINGSSSFSQKQEFACQTWLPIQTNASNVDLYNMYASAGYDPKLDAEKGTDSGELYCADSWRGGTIDTSLNVDNRGITQTKVNDGNYSNGVVSVMFDNKFLTYDCQGNSQKKCSGLSCVGEYLISGLLGSILGPIGFLVGAIMSNEIKNIVNSVDYDVSKAGAAFYHIICTQYPKVNQAEIDGTRIMSESEVINYSDGLQSSVYENLQAWAWNKIGPNAVVVRAEYGVEDNDAGFAPINRNDNSIRYWGTSSSDKASGINGRYVFSTPDLFINEENIKNIYFVPLNLKGTMRGIVPRQINTLSKSIPAIDTNSYLRLPIGEMRDSGTVNGKDNGSIKAFKSAYIRHFKDCWDMEEGNCSDSFAQGRIINFTGDPAADFVANNFKQYTYNVDENVDQNPPSLKTQPLLVWRYKTVKGDAVLGKGYFEDTIQKKYVLSWFANNTGKVQYVGADWGESEPHAYDAVTPAFMGSTLNSPLSDETKKLPADGADGDPFSTVCQTGFATAGTDVDSPHRNAWWAVAVNFDDTGKFLGFTTKWCNGLGEDTSDLNHTDSGNEPNSHWSNGDGGMNYAVIFELENQCTDFVKVHDDTGIVGTKNKAWTNRVWGNSTISTHPTPDYGSVISRSTPRLGFGSLNLSGDVTKNYNLQNPDTDGIPYACSYIFSVLGGSINSVNLSSIKSCNFSNDSFYRKDNSSKTYKGSTIDVIKTNSTGDSNTAISNLFAWFIGRQSLGMDGMHMFIIGTANSDDYSASFNTVSAQTTDGQYDFLLPPRVFSLNPFTCPVDGSANCTAGDADNITVNQVTGIKKDYNDDGVTDVDEIAQGYDFISRGSFDADIRFFAYADDNRMPIRKVTVNWGDSNTDITNVDKQGYYKNSKPVCSDGNGIVSLCLMHDEKLLEGIADVNNDWPTNMPSGLTCKADTDCPIELMGNGSKECLTAAELAIKDREGIDLFTYGAPRFGNSSRACTTAPFEFGHSYTCPEGSPGRKLVSSLSVDTQDRLQAMGISINDFVCVFKPRVQVIDNWGYCNGRCAEGSGYGGDYCYSDGVVENAFDNNSPDDAINKGECEWPDFTTYVSNPNYAPFTEYEGNIVIIPSSPSP